MGSVGAPGARAPRRSGSGGRVCKGVGAPDEGPSVGPAARAQRGAAQGRGLGPRRGVAARGRAGAQRGAA